MPAVAQNGTVIIITKWPHFRPQPSAIARALQELSNDTLLALIRYSSGKIEVIMFKLCAAVIYRHAPLFKRDRKRTSHVFKRNLNEILLISGPGVMVL